MRNKNSIVLANYHKIFYSAADLAAQLKKDLGNKKTEKVVYTGGVFDLFHFGHLNYLERSKALGDILIVHVDALSPDAAKRDKYDRPILPHDKKASIIASLNFVNYVLVENKRSYDDSILSVLKPDIFVRVKRDGQLESERTKRVKEFKKLYSFMAMVYLDPGSLSHEAELPAYLDTVIHVNKDDLNKKMRMLVAEARLVSANGFSYSGFKIGAAVSFNAKTFTGVNVSNASPPSSMCAERYAVYSGISNGFKELTEVCLFTPGSNYITPCGECRQVISEFSNPQNPTKVILANDTDVVLITDINKLLPMAFKSWRSKTKEISK